MTAGRCLLFRGEQCRTHKSQYQVPIAELAERWTELPQVSGSCFESRTWRFEPTVPLVLRPIQSSASFPLLQAQTLEYCAPRVLILWELRANFSLL
ncbi:hypothetical protein TNCV_3968051 [Trichonephila clavipes]|nr:hypothetical protein TNCV_3968051 [Trichonephila clavipes]